LTSQSRLGYYACGLNNLSPVPSPSTERGAGVRLVSFLKEAYLKIIKTAAFIIFVIALPLLLFTSAVRIVVNDLRLYHYGFVKYEITQATGGIELSELDRAANELVQYFNSDEERINIVLNSGLELYNRKEIDHLKDVKDLIWFGYKLQVYSLDYVLGYIIVLLALGGKTWLRTFSMLGRGLMHGGGLTLALMMAIGIAMLVAFDRVFLFFHLVGFSNLDWVLDPRTDRLIQMFPEDFFFDASLTLAGVTLALALLVGVVGWGLGFYCKKRLVAR